MSAIGKHVGRAFKPTLLVFAITFGILLTVAERAGLFGLPLAVILVLWYSKYLFVIVDCVAHGFDEPPVLSSELVAPFSDLRPLALLLLVSAIWMLTGALASWFGAPAVTAIRTMLLLALPASIALLAVDGNLLNAANPLAIGRVVLGLGLWYAALVAAVLLAGGAMYIIVGSAPLLVLQNIGLFLVTLVLASLIGGALYERREALGIDAWYSPERKAARRQREEDHEHDRFIDEVFALARNNSHQNAWRAVETRLEQAKFADSEYVWLLSALERIEDPRHLERLRQHYLKHLLAERRRADALRQLESIWQRAPQFRPADAGMTLTLARIAHESGTPRAARTLLADFNARFPNHPSAPIASALAAEVARSSRERADRPPS
jgi:hypothetical protein